MDDVPTDLRARRRLDTAEQIHQVALELFEKQGVRETTVQQIADRAGISSRTFFRYFASKEQAALPGQQRLLQVIDTLELSPGDSPATVLQKAEKAAESAMSGENDPGLAEHRRIARLLGEPELQALAAAQERTLTMHLHARLSAQLESSDPTTVRLIAELVVALWRTSWERWGELALEGHMTDPVEVYRHCRRELRRVVE
ncbi:TetR family transcriptional regulator [Cellulomonas sp. P22]|uniref:TetR family transcriptional regulator n=1 Tax=Cellulomonas sp. P22 TaxID=3373189 RepID=UPI0037B614DF